MMGTPLSPGAGRFLRGLLAPALAMFLGPAQAAERMPAACEGMTMAPAPPMPAPSGMKVDEPMPTGMAKPGAMKGDVMTSAAQSKRCMDQQLERDQTSFSANHKQ
ncbi:hypothetical protein DFR50_15627 [Roseiarcus fermentans]|uniref:Pentapeptide MXKDX repeat protein n=1 Tax=Roseiarcus fermentans TaxID=1473586 RepID=A0A366EJY9_9HYPH|nr:hypothetical protein DFR50_15627 [Roseiarcus fermentans]